MGLFSKWYSSTGLQKAQPVADYIVEKLSNEGTDSIDKIVFLVTGERRHVLISMLGFFKTKIYEPSWSDALSVVRCLTNSRVDKSLYKASNFHKDNKNMIKFD